MKTIINQKNTDYRLANLPKVGFADFRQIGLPKKAIQDKIYSLLLNRADPAPYCIVGDFKTNKICIKKKCDIDSYDLVFRSYNYLIQLKKDGFGFLIK